MDKEAIKYFEDRFNRLEVKVDALGSEVSETKEAAAYLRGRMDNGAPLKLKPNGNETVKYLIEVIRILVIALLAAFGVKYLGK